MNTQAVIEAVNTYADMLDDLRNSGKQFPSRGDRSPQANALRVQRDVYGNAIEIADTWKEIESLGEGRVILMSPDGLRVLYTPENGTERLAIL